MTEGPARHGPNSWRPRSITSHQDAAAVNTGTAWNAVSSRASARSVRRGVGVSNTTLVSVMERRAEIGVRRAVGAGRVAIAGQFLMESGILGLFGGVFGAVVGTDITLGVALVQQWVIVLDPRMALAGPLLGMLAGMVAGLYPRTLRSTRAPGGGIEGPTADG
ncbi:ABC transporter permease [Streptomyces sp. NPDC005791]